MSDSNFDVIIIGAGPAGTSTALFLADYNLRVLLLDKESFPRDKVCGDAVSGKSMNVLRDLNLIEEAQKLPGAIIKSITFSSPKNVLVDIPLLGDKQNGMPTGLVIPRKIYDNFLFEKASKKVTRAHTSFQAKEIIYEDKQVVGVKGINTETGDEESFYAKILVGADGFSSILAKADNIYNRDSKHWIVAVRQYFENVDDLDSQIELHFVDEIIPGYFWIFPAGNGLANVGLGIVETDLKKKKLNLKKALENVIKSAAFRERFKNAKAVNDVRGANLPVASIKRKAYGNGFLLTGDAAGLIDPFSGEGIGNAMVSGQFAAKTIKNAFDKGSFDAQTLKKYEDDLWKHLGAELRNSTLLQKLGQKRFLLNFVIKKAATNSEVKELISGMMANTISRKNLANPMFYFRLLFK